jgi:glycine hydroxymethyltransferase
MNGKEAEETLEREGIVVNKNVIPFDPLPPAITSGIRIGTAAVTTRGMKEEQMQEIATLIADVLRRKKRVREEVCRLCKEFPLYKELP